MRNSKDKKELLNLMPSFGFRLVGQTTRCSIYECRPDRKPLSQNHVLSDHRGSYISKIWMNLVKKVLAVEDALSFALEYECWEAVYSECNTKSKFEVFFNIFHYNFNVFFTEKITI